MTTATASSFWQRLEDTVAPYDLLKHPFYQAWTAGELTRNDLAAYAAEYWHHVSAFPTYLSALHSRLPDGETRREVLRNLSDEEGTDRAQGRPHSELWMDFAEGMGATRADVLGHQTQPETQALIATFRELMLEQPAAAMAALYAYESKVPGIAAEKAAGLEKLYGADAVTTRYFTLHRTADVHHAQVWRDLIDAELTGKPEAEVAALAAAERAAKALWCALDGIERERLN
jgi:pyrroloquinoline-quinone synthase